MNMVDHDGPDSDKKKTDLGRDNHAEAPYLNQIFKKSDCLERVNLAPPNKRGKCEVPLYNGHL